MAAPESPFLRVLCDPYLSSAVLDHLELADLAQLRAASRAMRDAVAAYPVDPTGWEPGGYLPMGGIAPFKPGKPLWGTGRLRRYLSCFPTARGVMVADHVPASRRVHGKRPLGADPESLALLAGVRYMSLALFNGLPQGDAATLAPLARAERVTLRAQTSGMPNGFTDAVLSPLTGVRWLHLVVHVSSHFTGAFLRHMPALEVLSLELEWEPAGWHPSDEFMDSSSSDEEEPVLPTDFFAHLAHTRVGGGSLHVLELTSSDRDEVHYADEHLALLRSSTSLEALHLVSPSTDVTEEGIVACSKMLRRLNVLGADGYDCVRPDGHDASDGGYAHSLTDLRVRYCDAFTGAALRQLRALKSVVVENCPEFTSSAFAGVSANCTHLLRLHVCKCDAFDDTTASATLGPGWATRVSSSGWDAIRVPQGSELTASVPLMRD